MLRAILRNSGFDPRRILAAIRGWHRYSSDRKEFRSLPGCGNMPWGRELPMLTEWQESSGGLGGYFFQDLTVARWIHEASPVRHVDIGSRIDGFIGHLAVFREVEAIDIRPQPKEVRNVVFHQLDLMQPIPPEWMECTDSLSCLHTIEHFGLGRYGDPLDPDGHLKGIEQLKHMVKAGGILYLSTLIGRERIEFNAHRVFSPGTLLGWFGDDWSVERSALVDDGLDLDESEGVGAVKGFNGNTGVGIVAARRKE